MTNEEKDNLILLVKELSQKYDINILWAKAPPVYRTSRVEDVYSSGVEPPFCMHYNRKLIKEEDAGSGSEKGS